MSVKGLAFSTQGLYLQGSGSMAQGTAGAESPRTYGLKFKGLALTFLVWGALQAGLDFTDLCLLGVGAQITEFRRWVF